jgi:tRNA pseudouridine65 synthase
VLLFALHKECAQKMSELLREHRVEKRYQAIVRGYTHTQGEIEHPLRKIVDRYGEKVYRSTLAQQAKTNYRCLATAELPWRVDRYPTSRYSLIELVPHTGRRHQLRRHCKHIAHPIIGDPKYGKSGHNRLFQRVYGSSRLLLAAVSLRFVHPYTNATLAISAEPDESFMYCTRHFVPLPGSHI